MNKLFLVLLLVMGGIASSCTTIKIYSIEQISPADVTFPASLRTVAVINNTPMPIKRWPDKFTPADMVESIDGDGKTTAEALATHIAEENYFDQVLICDSALRQHDFSRRTSMLEKKEVERLADDLGVDALISLEGITVKATPNLVYTMDSEQPIGVINVTVSSLVRVYLPTRQGPLSTLADKDSIYWVTSYIDEEEIISKASDLAATLSVKHLLPVWNTATRFYYSGGSVDMRDAEISIKENNWDDALTAWKRIYSSKSKRKQMYASFNIALYYELHDDLEEAEKWVRKAMDFLPGESNAPQYSWSDDYRVMRYYLSELEKRKENIEKLKVQMNRFEDDF